MNKCALLIHTGFEQGNSRGQPGFEPGTCRSAVECSTTELYPHEYGNK